MTVQPTARQSRRRRKPPIETEAFLEDWGQKGSVLTHVAGRAVPIDRGIPGETVAVLIDRGRGARGVVDRVITPSPMRVDPRCPYYLLGCGGCQVQHLEYAAQLEFKRA